MREIKFRGYNGDKWVYGDLIHDSCNGHELIFIDDNVERTRHSVDKDTVGQFTGLLDCEGREIYEGDIVKFVKPAYTDVPVVITWEDGAFMVDHDLYLGARDLSRITVIGNVYDNPELIKK